MRVGITKVAQTFSFAPHVPNLTRNFERQLVVLDGLSRLAQIRVGIAKIAQMDAFHCLIL